MLVEGRSHLKYKMFTVYINPGIHICQSFGISHVIQSDELKT